MTTLDVLISSGSVADMIEQLDYLNDVGSRISISREVNKAKVQVTGRAKTAVTKAKVATVTRTIAVRTAQVRSERDRLLRQPETARLGQEPEAREARVRRGQQGRVPAQSGSAGCERPARRAALGLSRRPTTASASGLIWPVGGPVTSGFGWRWGSMHEGIGRRLRHTCGRLRQRHRHPRRAGWAAMGISS